MRLKGKVAIITGSSRGIGKATALLFAKEGAKVVINYNKSEKEAKDIVSEIKALGTDVISVKCDVSDENEVKSMIDKTIDAFGRIDILVNNAGVFDYTDSMNFNDEDWEKMIGPNIKGTIFCIQRVSKIMLKQKRGTIVNISSISGTNDWGLCLEYEISKSAVNAITKHYAIKLAPNIRVNCIAPGGTDTDMAMKHSKERKEAYIEKTPLKKRARPEEIANTVLFLASDEASYITGQILTVDGGYTLK